MSADVHNIIISAQTNQIMTTACVIVKLQPEQFNRVIKRNKLQNYYNNSYNLNLNPFFYQSQKLVNSYKQVWKLFERLQSDLKIGDLVNTKEGDSPKWLDEVDDDIISLDWHHLMQKFKKTYYYLLKTSPICLINSESFSLLS